jgi:drug/metabolite transporter (DMT)-like permease
MAGVVLFKEPFGGLQYVGAPMLAGGIVLFFHDSLGELVGGASSASVGIAYIIAAAVAWAACATAQKKLLRIYGSFPLMWMIYGVAVLLMTPLASPLEALKLDSWRAWMLFYCSATTVLGYGMFSEALKMWEASRVGAVVAVTPLFTWVFTLLAAAVIPARVTAEPIDGLSILGAVAVAAGSALAALGRRTPAPIPLVPTAAHAPQAPAAQSR